ncbi:hypothetical protein KA005_01910 [bacterium]|nr:hypothetical protein [bacterium]
MNIEEIRGIRHRITYREENLYITIFPNKAEIFICSVKQDQDPLTGAALDAISRMTTLAWKGSTVDEVIDQLRKASRSTKDIPGILARLLSEEI